MGKASQAVEIDASLAEVWDHYFEPRAWSSWVDGFGQVRSSDGYPEKGGTLVWTSRPAGRGEVTERVLEHEPRRLHRVSFSDPESTGELETTFQIAGDGVEVTQTMSYEIRKRGALGRGLTDLFFVRGQVRGSLGRSLTRLKGEVEDAAAEDADG